MAWLLQLAVAAAAAAAAVATAAAAAIAVIVVNAKRRTRRVCVALSVVRPTLETRLNLLVCSGTTCCLLSKMLRVGDRKRLTCQGLY